MPDQVRHDEVGNDGVRGERWRKALARFARAEAGLAAVAHSEDDEAYGRALGRHGAALARLLRTPALGLDAVAGKLDLIVRHSVFESPFGEASFKALRRDILRIAAQPAPQNHALGATREFPTKSSTT